MPEPASTVQQAILYRKGRSMMGGSGGMRTAVRPRWNMISVDDIYSGSAKGERYFTMSRYPGRRHPGPARRVRAGRVQDSRLNPEGRMAQLTVERSAPVEVRLSGRTLRWRVRSRSSMSRDENFGCVGGGLTASTTGSYRMGTPRPCSHSSRS